MNIKGLEYFEELIAVHNRQIDIKDKYPRLRALLERACKDLTADENIQFSNLFSRLNYICDKKGLDKRKTYQINTFRINANKVLHAELSPTKEVYLQDIKALSNAISHFYSVSIPAELSTVLPKTDRYQPQKRQGKKYDRIRVEVSSTDGDFIYAFDEDNPTEDPIKIKYNVPGINDEFAQTVASLWKGCQLNLIDVTVDEHGLYFPELIVLEPDYLIDISSLAECMKDYGRHPLNYVQSKFESMEITPAILLGNTANSFLDDLVNEQPHQPVVYANSMRNVFRSNPFEFAACVELEANDKDGESFFDKAKKQFNNIRNVVNNVFPSKNINRDLGLLEPSFICEQLGVQGRLDYLQLRSDNGKQVVIELKSGKAPFPETDVTKIGLNHRSQLFLYQIVIQKVLGVDFKDLSTYIFYSKYTDNRANLRLSAPFMAAIKEIVNIRNLIVSCKSSA